MSALAKVVDALTLGGRARLRDAATLLVQVAVIAALQLAIVTLAAVITGAMS